jgi:hypothetical protein
LNLLGSKLAPEGPDPAHSACSRVKLCGGLAMVALEGIELGLKAAKLSDDGALLIQ